MAASAQIVDLIPTETGAPLAVLLKAASDELRLHILRVLAQDSFSVSELCTIFDLRQSALSHHLKILIDAGLLNRRKEGTAIFYRRALAEGPLHELQEQILRHIDETPITRSNSLGIERVQQQREDNSIAFFNGNADRFREQQELIAPWVDYSEITLQLLDRLESGTFDSIIEVGVGEGWLLPDLAKRARCVTALDLSQDMLDLAQEHSSHLRNVSFVQGSTDVLVQRNQQADAIVVNMVLHHTSEPEKVLAEAACLLKSGGHFIVSELCAHDQAWAREHCGDLWLGFTPEQLEIWAGHVGLSLNASVFLAQRNGFQIQVQHFQSC
ncbi:metalloregulator ArsR/SmtB family transcription factor [Luminiphilus sp.]|nr:metalloregulator ArsR/SmtB family transcription factor [Luminiphilus sp.]MDA9711765.1 metalloregulator ArsR/SmtB family transcription factor [Luminiphilus sp.]